MNRVTHQVTDRDLMIRRKRGEIDALTHELARLEQGQKLSDANMSRDRITSSSSSSSGFQYSIHTGKVTEVTSMTSSVFSPKVTSSTYSVSTPKRTSSMYVPSATSVSSATSSTSVTSSVPVPGGTSNKYVPVMTSSIQIAHPPASKLSHAYSCGDLSSLTVSPEPAGKQKYLDSDSNSDTGLSSLHSDEIHSADRVVLETLV